MAHQPNLLVGLADTLTKVIKPADESRQSNNTFADDSTLTFAFVQDAFYAFRFRIFCDVHTTPGIKFRTTWTTATGTIRYIQLRTGPTDTQIVTDGAIGINSDTFDITTQTGKGFVEIVGNFTITSGAGTCKLEWAQVTSDSNPVTVLKGSYIEYRQIT